jgi:hypothetical protein
MGGDGNTDLRAAREVVVVTSGVRFKSRDGRADCMGARAATVEAIDRDA